MSHCIQVAGVSLTRRGFLAQAGTLGALTLSPFHCVRSEPPPETNKLRLMAYPSICGAPQYLAEAMLKAEGFSQIEYAKMEDRAAGSSVGPNKADFDIDSVGAILTYIDAGHPAVVVSGAHLGCYELFGSKRVRAVRDLKGKTVPVDGFGGPKHVFLSSVAAYVGIDPRKDINWVNASVEECKKLYVEGRADAYLGFAPEPQELRAKKFGPVILNTTTDKPWSNYYCCLLYTHREFVRNNPVATKRAVRAILKAADLCASDPARAARLMVDKGFTQNYDFALQSLKELRYNVWRSYNPEDSLRFHGIRLHEVGMIKNTPQKLIAQGTHWRFLDELKRELKA